jgi:hypothetical protein
MSISTNIHYVTDIAVTSDHPDNNNALTIRFSRRNDDDFEITMFGRDMNQKTRAALIAALKDADE